MRILNCGGPYLVDVLRDQGHQVVSVGLAAQCDVRLTHPIQWTRLAPELESQGFVPECAFWIDDGNLPFLLGMETMPCPTLFYSIDTFCNPWHPSFSFAFDQAFVAQKGFVELFHQLAGAPEWLPLFAPDALMAQQEPDATRDIPVAFVGTLRPRNIPQRFPFLEAFKRLHPLFVKQGAYAPIFRRAGIVLNQTASQEVNFRCFEAMACGAALLTERGPHGLDDLFVPGEHILPPYEAGDAAQAAAVCRFWLAEPERLQALATAGRERVRKQHLASHRAAFLVQRAAALRNVQAHAVRLGNLQYRRKLVASAYGMLAAELTEDTMREHQKFFMDVCAALQD